MTIAVLDIVNIISVVGWAVVIASFLAMLSSWIVFWQDTTRRSGLFFFLFGIVNFFWASSYAAFEWWADSIFLQLVIGILYAVAALVPVFFFLFLLLFSFGRSTISLRTLIALFVPYILLAGTVIIHPDFVVVAQGVQDGISTRIMPGQGFWIYGIYLLSYFIAGFIVLFQKYRKSAGIFKIAIRRLFIAVSAAYVFSLCTSFLSPVYLGTTDFFWVGHIAISLLIFITSVIIARYNFWNFQVVLTEFMLAVIVTIMIVEIYLANSTFDLFIKTIITLLIVFSCTFLDESVKREIYARDKILSLSEDIDSISRRLKVLDKKKSEFLVIASHHLRDPLTAIKGYASMLLGGSFGELPTKVREAVEKIFDSSERLITMIADFMDISRIESGEMHYAFSDVDVKKLVLGLVDEMKQGAVRVGLHFSAKIDRKSSSGSYITTADEGKLRQVFSNLIDNAIKYTPQGEITIFLSKGADGKKILFGITDTGIGMSDMTKEKIFRKFSRAEGVGKVYTEGTGLGLYVAKEVINKHAGRIWAESKGEGKGSTFYVELDAKG